MSTLPTREIARVPGKAVAWSIIGVWTCYFAITTARSLIVGLDFQDEMLWRRALVSLAGAGVTVVLWLVLRAFDHRSLAVKGIVTLLGAMPASMLIAQINQTVFAGVEAKVIASASEPGVRVYRDETGNLLAEVPHMTGPDTEVDTQNDGARTITLLRAPQGFERWRQLTDIALVRYFLLLAWCSLYLALLYGAQARLAERREGEFRRAAKAAELRSLRYQVNPHFLFNTLNSLSSLVMTGKTERAEQMIQAVSNFYRHSLADDPTSDVALEDEFDLQRQYLAIEQARFADRLVPRFDLPMRLADARVPGMILQPLVENAVKYAVAPHARPITITLAAREEAGELVVSVEDDGPGGATADHGMGIGLANVRDRLEARFGTAARLSTGPRVGGGYTAELRMPLALYEAL